MDEAEQMDNDNSLRNLVNSSEPLNRSVATRLVEYSEEDDCLDYKQTFVIDDKGWFGLVKDTSAFANTFGGYLVFGVSDDNKIIGLTKDVESTLKDINLIHQKMNSHLEPELTGLRSQSFRFEGKTIVILYIPRSKNRTHLIKRDAILHKQSKTPKVALHEGTFYIRRSGHNHMADSRDLDDVVERRVDKFRESLLGKVAQVIQSTTESEVYVLSRDVEAGDNQRFIIEDSPDAKHMKGLSFTIAPEEAEEEVAAWSVLSKRTPALTPPFDVVWGWYETRDSLKLTEKQKLSVFKFCLLSQIPAFYWIRDIENSLIREVLLDVLRVCPNSIELKPFLIIAAFLGKGAYSAALKILGGKLEKLPNRLKIFPIIGAYEEHCKIKPTKKEKIKILENECLTELEDLVEKAKKSKNGLSATNRWRAQDLDLFLYVKKDNYKTVKKK